MSDDISSKAARARRGDKESDVSTDHPSPSQVQDRQRRERKRRRSGLDEPISLEPVVQDENRDRVNGSNVLGVAVDEKMQRRQRCSKYGFPSKQKGVEQDKQLQNSQQQTTSRTINQEKQPETHSSEKKKSKYNGVYRHKADCWVVLYNAKYWGRFSDEVEAAKAYDRAIIEVGKHPHKLNFPEQQQIVLHKQPQTNGFNQHYTDAYDYPFTDDQPNGNSNCYEEDSRDYDEPIENTQAHNHIHVQLNTIPQPQQKRALSKRRKSRLSTRKNSRANSRKSQSMHAKLSSSSQMQIYYSQEQRERLRSRQMRQVEVILSTQEHPETSTELVNDQNQQREQSPQASEEENPSSSLPQTQEEEMQDNDQNAQEIEKHVLEQEGFLPQVQQESEQINQSNQHAPDESLPEVVQCEDYDEDLHEVTDTQMDRNSKYNHQVAESLPANYQQTTNSQLSKPKENCSHSQEISLELQQSQPGSSHQLRRQSRNKQTMDASSRKKQPTLHTINESTQNAFINVSNRHLLVHNPYSYLSRAQHTGVVSVLPELQQGEARVLGFTLHPTVVPSFKSTVASWNRNHKVVVCARNNLDPEFMLSLERQIENAYLKGWPEYERNSDKLPQMVQGMNYHLVYRRRIQPGDRRCNLIGQYGLFAQQDIPKGTVIGTYRGYIFNQNWSNAYHKRLCPEAFFDIYTDYPEMLFNWEEVVERYSLEICDKYICVPHGYGDYGCLINDPNVDVDVVWRRGYYVHDNWCEEDFRHPNLVALPNIDFISFKIKDFPLPFIVSTRNIAEGQEILFQYGPGYWYGQYDRQQSVHLLCREAQFRKAKHSQQ
eukprot:TRINITY_DN481_c0_g1_i2.p1 TRINITY_DN481_c0_g1~~TRINITY_DN481_c0_g1_i2.p1  ORF type:complete len:826 (-),score=101.23 TRINITY_DN481_c0_g1_i2:4672-7149(-)